MAAVLHRGASPATLRGGCASSKLTAGWAPSLSLLLYFLTPLIYFALVAFLQTDRRTKVGAADIS